LWGFWTLDKKWRGESNSPQLDSSYNRFAILSRVIENKSCCNLNNRDMLREVTVKIRLERIDTQKEVTVEDLLDSGATRLVMGLEFTQKQGFKLKKNRKTDICKEYGWFF